MIRNYYHLLLVVGVWLLKKLKIFENLSGFQGSATIDFSITHFNTTLTITNIIKTMDYLRVLY